MGLETPVYITDLVTTNPVSTDAVSAGDDHIRNLKVALAGTFTGFTGAAMSATEAELNFNDGSTAGTSVASKTLVLGSSKETDVLTLTTLTSTNVATPSNTDLVISPNGTGDVDFNACSIMIDTGEGIKDAGGANYITFTEDTTPVNSIGIENADTTLPPIISSKGEADIGLRFNNKDGEELFQIGATASTVNSLTVTGSATGNPVILANNGEDDIGFSFNAKNGEQMLILAATAAAVNEITVTSQSTGVYPSISCTGEADTGIDFLNDQGEEILVLNSIASAVNEVQISNSATGNGVIVEATGGDTNININMVPKGSGKVDVQGGFMTSETTSLSGAGAVAITGAIHEITTTGTDALTLADGVEGQRLCIVMVTDGGDGTLTPTSGGGYTTITFADAGDSCELLFTNSNWYVLGSGGLAGGPVVA